MKKFVFMSREKFEALIRQRLEEASWEASRSYERDLLMKQANIASLQSQINPHFLYNTLECIRGQAMLEGSDEIASTAQALSLFFRYSISAKSNLVTLEEELRNVDNYVKIQQYRFKNRFRLQVELCGENVQNAILPKLSLQPVLENAIIHGFSDITHGGEIRIQVERSDDFVTIQISDNGKGMDMEQLGQLCAKIQDSGSMLGDGKDGPGTGIGLENVDRRIKLFFGNEYGISVNSCPDVGTDVTFFFPCRLSANCDETDFPRA